MTTFVIRFDEGRRRWVVYVAGVPILCERVNLDAYDSASNLVDNLVLEGYPARVDLYQRKGEVLARTYEPTVPAKFNKRRK